jgi:hypothetical protein
MVTEINPDAWTIAKELDEERACGKLRGYNEPFPYFFNTPITLTYIPQTTPWTTDSYQEQHCDS